jgi:hypothetical protein
LDSKKWGPGSGREVNSVVRGEPRRELDGPENADRPEDPSGDPDEVAKPAICAPFKQPVSESATPATRTTPHL